MHKGTAVTQSNAHPDTQVHVLQLDSPLKPLPGLSAERHSYLYPVEGQSHDYLIDYKCLKLIYTLSRSNDKEYRLLHYPVDKDAIDYHIPDMLPRHVNHNVKPPHLY